MGTPTSNDESWHFSHSVEEYKNNVKMRICIEFSSRFVFCFSESFVCKFERNYRKTPGGSSKGYSVWRRQGKRMYKEAWNHLTPEKEGL